MSFLEVYGIEFVVTLVLMMLLWLFSLRLRNSSIVDIFWGMGFVIANWIYFALTPDGYFLRKLLVSTLVTIWGLRLSIHILLRNWGKPEDFRYQKWRIEAGSRWWWQSLFQVFMLQGVLLWVISVPLLAAQYRALPGHLTIFDFLGVTLWLVGFYFEAVGDLQLSLFKAKPENKGKILDSGVWHYTRHPNYFGDSAQWWGYFLIATSSGGWWTIISPILMTLFLLRVSGVALLEKTLETRPGYKEYIDRTSAFIPWIPRDKQSKPGKANYR
jgi:steroid 5-alpha reductase family enzyme